MLYIKAFHIIAMVAWFAGLFYLPRLFVYHTDAKDNISLDRFKIMEYRLYYCIMWPAMILTVSLGVALILYNPGFYLTQAWMHLKLGLVALLCLYHLRCGHHIKMFIYDKNINTSRFFRIFNELPTLILIAIVLLIVVKPKF